MNDPSPSERMDLTMAKVRRLNLLRSAGNIMLGAAALITSVVVWQLVDQVGENGTENRCRARINAELDTVDSDISYNGWMGILAFYEGDRDEALRRAEVVRQLADERRIATDRQDHAVDICD